MHRDIERTRIAEASASIGVDRSRHLASTGKTPAQGLMKPRRWWLPVHRRTVKA
jgi:hypothetical protein